MWQENVNWLLQLAELKDFVFPHMVSGPHGLVIKWRQLKVAELVVVFVVYTRCARNAKSSVIDHASKPQVKNVWSNPAAIRPFVFQNRIQLNIYIEENCARVISVWSGKQTLAFSRGWLVLLVNWWAGYCHHPVHPTVRTVRTVLSSEFPRKKKEEKKG